MDQVRLGATGLHVSRVCLGMMSFGNDSDRPWVLDEAAAEPIIRRAVEGGITFFDTADVYREEKREMIPQCIDQGVGVIPWSPLARGFLTGTRTREGERRTTRAETDGFQDLLYGRDEDFDVIDRLNEVAAARGDSSAQVALAWLLHEPGVTAPIVGATKLEHLEDALAAADLTLSADEIERLQEPYVPHPVLGHE